MKKKFKAKVSGMFDIVQLGDDTFSEVVDKLKANDYHIDQQFTSREECYIEAIGDGGTKCVSRGDMVFTDETGELFIMSEKRFNATYEEVEEDSNYTGQNMSFGEALQALEAGKCVARKGWITTCFVVKQIDSDIPAEVVPKMQSLPQHAKNLLNAFGVGSISYRSQCLLVEQAGDGNGATNYVPDWVDMFAKDWFVLGGE